MGGRWVLSLRARVAARLREAARVREAGGGAAAGLRGSARRAPQGCPCPAAVRAAGAAAIWFSGGRSGPERCEVRGTGRGGQDPAPPAGVLVRHPAAAGFSSASPGSDCCESAP